MDEIDNPKDFIRASMFLSGAMNIGTIVFRKKSEVVLNDFMIKAKKWRKKLGVSA